MTLFLGLWDGVEMQGGGEGSMAVWGGFGWGCVINV